MNKRLLDAAIECRMPMYWKARYGYGVHNRFELRVVTWRYETGKERTRVVHVSRGMEDALNVSLEVYASKGQLDCSELLANDLDIWAYGWRPELSPLKDQVRALYFATRFQSVQALWDEFAARMRGGKQ